MTDRLSEAFAAVERSRFLPAYQRAFARQDRPLGIGFGQTNSQPTTVHNMLRLLDVQPGHRVLDVGAGSGWTTALLGHLVGPAGKVVGVELIPALARWGAENLDQCDMGWTSIQVAEPGVYGVPDAGPFDRILVSAGARELPPGLVDQLVAGGVMVIPVDGQMFTVVHHADGTTDIDEHGRYSFVPLLPRSVA